MPTGIAAMTSQEIAVAQRIHSVNFIKLLSNGQEEYNSYGDFHIIPSEMPFIVPAPPVFSYVTVPGAKNGEVDVSTALTGEMMYGNREGSLKFLYENKYRVATPSHSGSGYMSPFQIATAMSAIHGQEVKLILMDNPSIYYKGRVWIETFIPGQQEAGTIEIKYKFEPYSRNVSNDNQVSVL